MELFMNNSRNKSFRMDRSLSMSDLESYSAVNLNLGMLNINNSPLDQRSNIRDPLGRHNSCSHINHTSVFNSTCPTGVIASDDPFKRNNWNYSTSSVLSPIAKLPNTHINSNLSYNRYCNITANSNSPFIKHFGELNNCEFNSQKLCNEKMKSFENLREKYSDFRNVKKIELCNETPMDIDKSLDSPKKIPFEQVEVQKPNRKWYIERDNSLNMECEAKEVVSSENTDDKTEKKVILGNITSIILALIISLSVYFILWVSSMYDNQIGVLDNIIKIGSKVTGKQLEYCELNYDVENLSKELRLNLFGQEDVERNLPEYLNFNDNFQLLLFTGGTGVGKSFSTDIIMNTFLWKNNIHKYQTLNSIEDSAKKIKLYNSLSNCGHNLIVLDDLLYGDFNDIVGVIDNVWRISKDKQLKTVMILVYNIQEITDSAESNIDIDKSTDDILQDFKNQFNINLNFKVVQFKFLKLESLISCVKTAASKLKIHVSKEVIEEIARNLGDLKGCKGAEIQLKLWKAKNNNNK